MRKNKADESSTRRRRRIRPGSGSHGDAIGHNAIESLAQGLGRIGKRDRGENR